MNSDHGPLEGTRTNRIGRLPDCEAKVNAANGRGLIRARRLYLVGPFSILLEVHNRL